MNPSKFAFFLKFIGVILLTYLLVGSNIPTISNIALCWIALSLISTGIWVQRTARKEIYSASKKSHQY